MEDSIKGSDSDETTILEVTIDFGEGCADNIKIHDDDDIDELLTNFCSKHKLNPIIKPKLAEEINAKLSEPYVDSRPSPEISAEEPSVSSSKITDDDDTASIATNESITMNRSVHYFDINPSMKQLTCKPKCEQKTGNANGLCEIFADNKEEIKIVKGKLQKRKHKMMLILKFKEDHSTLLETDFKVIKNRKKK